ncbi:MAG TPA: hypothetical protein VE733_11345, partial [Streptosporangiaceae bacterium]|nr:hypothetical protein [Streptosporangiaceae bacterium]
GEAADSRQANELRTDTRVVGEAADSRSTRDASGAATDGAGPDKIPWGRSGPKRDAPDIGVERWWSHPPEEKPERDVEIGRGYYWTEVPRFLANWQDHKDRWPDVRCREVDQSIDPEQLAEVVESAETVPEAEPPISDNIQRIESENVHSGWLEGFEFRLKGQDRLIEKAVEKLTAEADRTPKDIVQGIPDAIRYTFCFREDIYSAGYWDVKGRLEACGYEMYHSKNWWANPEYKGINTRWVTPEGWRFEVQFHTEESFHAKHEVTHQAYERARSPLTSKAELAKIEQFQREVSSWIPIPDGVKEISDYKKGF